MSGKVLLLIWSFILTLCSAPNAEQSMGTNIGLGEFFIAVLFIAIKKIVILFILVMLLKVFGITLESDLILAVVIIIFDLIKRN